MVGVDYLTVAVMRHFKGFESQVIGRSQVAPPDFEQGGQGIPVKGATAVSRNLASVADIGAQLFLRQCP